MGNEIIHFLKINWQWLVIALSIPTLFGAALKMCLKYLFPIHLRVSGGNLGFGDFKAGETEVGSTTLIYAGKKEAYLSLTVIRRPRLDEFHDFWIEIPQLGKIEKGNVAALLERDTSPHTLRISLGLVSDSEQAEWRAKLVGDIKVIIKIRAGWRERWPVTEKAKVTLT